MRFPYLLVLLLTIYSPFSTVRNASASVLAPLDNNDCKTLWKGIQNVLRATDQCIFLCTEYVDCPFHLTNQTMVTISLESMFDGTVFKYQSKFFCDKIVATFEDFHVLRYYLQNRNLNDVFQPFTRIQLISLRETSRTGVMDSPRQANQVLFNAWYLYFVRLFSNYSFYQIEDGVTGQVINVTNHLDATIKTKRGYLLHPLFDYKTGKEFRVSLFHCPPYVIKLNNESTIDSYDGAEFRFVKEISKNWNVKIIDRHGLYNVTDVYKQVADDVLDHTAHMGLCSMWITIDKFRRFDLAHFFSSQCGTFLVPKPTPITQASYIYLPLSDKLWMLLFSSLVLTALLYYLLYQRGLESRYFLENLSSAFLDIINITTSHGLPNIVHRLPIRILVISWVLLNLLMGTAYSTKYTSMLTQPIYTKAIDTIEDFIDEGLYWGQVGERPMWKVELRDTGNPYYIELARRMLVEKDLSDRISRIANGKYGAYVKVLSNNYVTDTGPYAHLSSSLRLMRDCIGNYFTTFPFLKHSSLTRYANSKLGIYTDSGIIDYWFRLMNIKYGKTYIASFFDKNIVKQNVGPVALKIENLVGAFYLLGIGLAMSFIVFLLELIVQRTF